jgi:hypothetical protein
MVIPPTYFDGGRPCAGALVLEILVPFFKGF